MWNPVDRSFAEGDQNGELVGISSIKAPLRLELYPFAAGYYEINFAADNLTSGIYITKLTVGSHFQTIKMNLLK